MSAGERDLRPREDGGLRLGEGGGRGEVSRDEGEILQTSPGQEARGEYSARDSREN